MNEVSFDKVLTTGSSGMIGAYVDFGLCPTLEELDITNESQVAAYVSEHKPAVIIHLAAAADMVRCESEPAYAYELNVRGTYNVARAAAAVGAKLVFASSSRVFAGDKDTPYTEGDVPKPETHYGRTKHICEMMVRELVPEHIIARTAWVFGGGKERDNKFYGKVLAQLEAGATEIVALRDVAGSPTYGKDYIATVKQLLRDGAIGTYHITNAGVASRYDIAVELAKAMRPDVLVKAVERSYFPNGQDLPTNEAVVSEHCQLRPWQEALAEYVKEEWTV